MRHLGSLTLAVVVAPLALVLAARGLDSFLDATGGQPPDPLATATAVAALGLAGLLFALLVVPRFSPLGPVLAGAGYLAVGLWALADLDNLLATVPAGLIGLADRAVALTAGISPLLAAPLLVTLFSGQRWRGSRDAHEPSRGYAEAAAQPPRRAPQTPPARPVDSTREFPAVPAAQQWPTGPAREWPTEPIRPTPSPHPTSPRPTPGPAAADPRAGSPADEPTTVAIPTGDGQTSTEQTTAAQDTPAQPDEDMPVADPSAEARTDEPTVGESEDEQTTADRPAPDQPGSGPVSRA
jgi:hypothetical protein